jgi:glycosyltransferase involved in cell wall biosynthesis
VLRETVRFSLITATRNSAHTLERCLQSVRAQRHRDLEHLLVDGGSSDETLSILTQHHQAGSLRLLCSEPDRSVYEAWNKALSQISGDWVLFLGSDDWLASPDSLAQAAAAISQHPEAQHCDFVCGHALGSRGERIGLTPSSWAWRHSENRWNRWRGSLPLPCHSAIIHRHKLFSQGALFDESYRICADAKFLWQNNFFDRHCWINVEICAHQPGGLSQNKATIALQRKERGRMLTELGRPRPLLIEPILILKNYLNILNYRPR